MYAVSRNPILAYNVTVVLFQALAGCAAYYAARRLTGSSLAGWVGGIVFALSPMRTGYYQFAHMQLSFAMPLAFLAFAYCDMLIATGERGYAERLRDTCQTILSFERQNRAVNGSMQSGFLMGCNHDALPYVDCHASCLLALVRATELLDDPLWLPSIDRGLAAYCIDTVSIGFQGKNHKEDLVGVDYLAPDGVRHTMHTFWNFTSGLSLRLFNALRAARHPGLRDLWAEHATRITAMEWLMRNRIQRSLRPRDGSVEILTSVLSGETNSETQPWVALGLSGRV